MRLARRLCTRKRPPLSHAQERGRDGQRGGGGDDDGGDRGVVLALADAVALSARAGGFQLLQGRKREKLLLLMAIPKLYAKK